MTTPTITLYPDTLPAKGQANDAFDVNVNSFLNWLTLTNGPELATMITFTVDVRDTVLATALAGNLPPLTGEALNLFRVNAAENGGEFRTPLQVKADIGLGGITDNSTANAITIDASGNVGIGTATPTAALDIIGGIRLNKDGGLTTAKVGNFGISGFEGYIEPYNTSGFTKIVNTLSGGHVAVETGGAERLRILSGGETIFGSATPVAAGFTNVVFNGSSFFGMAMKTTGPVGSAFMSFHNSANTQVGTIVQASASTTVYNTSSDYRLKENITPIQGAADIVKAMRPCTYTFTTDGVWSDGFLAHELQELHPLAVTGVKDAMKDEDYEVTPAAYEDVIVSAVEAVAEVLAVYDDDGVLVFEGVPAVAAEPERTEQRLVSEAVMGTRTVPDYQQVDYSKLTPILTAALQEALAKIDDLTARITVLEGAA
jgi:hypothetical protein